MGVAVANIVAVFPSHIVGLVTAGVVGKALIVTLAVVVLLHVPLLKLYVTVYVPAVLAPKFIAPVLEFILKPDVEL